MKGRKTILTPDEHQYLIENFPELPNIEVARHLNLSVRTVVRLARQEGLAKSEAFRQRCREKAAQASHIYQLLHPMPKGFAIPNREKNQFRKGETQRDRLSPEKYEQWKEKLYIARQNTIKSERRRILFGLPQRTNLKLQRQPREKILLRYYLRKCGYIINDKERIAYYTPYTKRGTRIEAKNQPWYTFAPLPSTTH